MEESASEISAGYGTKQQWQLYKYNMSSAWSWSTLTLKGLKITVENTLETN